MPKDYLLSYPSIYIILLYYKIKLVNLYHRWKISSWACLTSRRCLLIGDIIGRLLIQYIYIPGKEFLFIQNNQISKPCKISLSINLNNKIKKYTNQNHSANNSSIFYLAMETLPEKECNRLKITIIILNFKISIINTWKLSTAMIRKDSTSCNIHQKFKSICLRKIKFISFLKKL